MNQTSTADKNPEVMERSQEVDVWWGSYSGWTMVPSFLGCILLTGMIAWFGFTFVREKAQRTILLASAVVWLVQGGRWAWRFFGISYRLTNRRLFIDNGFFRPVRQQVEMSAISKVRPEKNCLDRLVGVAHIYLEYADPTQKSVVLEGVRNPEEVKKLLEKVAGNAN